MSNVHFQGGRGHGITCYHTDRGTACTGRQTEEYTKSSTACSQDVLSLLELCRSLDSRIGGVFLHSYRLEYHPQLLLGSCNDHAYQVRRFRKLCSYAQRP